MQHQLQIDDWSNGNISLIANKNYNYLVPVYVDLKSKHFVIYENSIISLVWNTYTFIIVILLVIILPFQISEEDLFKNDMLQLSDNIISFSLLIDIIINFVSVSYNPNGRIIDSHKEIAYKYFTSYFAIDLLTSFPYEFVLLTLSNSSSPKFVYISKIPRIWRMMKIAKVIRLFKVLKITSIMNKLFGKINITSATLNLMKLSVLMLIVSHIMVCLFVFQKDSNNPDWYKSIYSEPDVVTYTQRYLLSWYFIVQSTTTVGYGDLNSSSNTEFVMKVFMILVGVSMWSWVMADIVEMKMENSMISIGDRNMAELLNQISNRYKLSFRNGSNLNQLLYSGVRFKMADDYNIINLLPFRNRNIVLYDIYMYFSGMNILINSNYSFFEKIFRQLRMKFFTENEYLWYEGFKSDTVFLMSYGDVGFCHSLLSKYKLTADGIYRVKEYGILGLDECFVNDKSNYSCICLDTTEVFYLHYMDYWKTYESSMATMKIFSIIVDNYREYIKNMAALMFTLHMFQINSIYIKNFDLYALTDMLHLTQNNSFDNSLNVLNSLLKKYGINPTFDPNSATHYDLWYKNYLQDNTYEVIINKITDNFLKSNKKIKFFEKYMIQKKPLVTKEGKILKFEDYIAKSKSNKKDKNQYEEMLQQIKQGFINNKVTKIQSKNLVIKKLREYGDEDDAYIQEANKSEEDSNKDTDLKQLHDLDSDSTSFDEKQHEIFDQVSSEEDQYDTFNNLIDNYKSKFYNNMQHMDEIKNQIADLQIYVQKYQNSIPKNKNTDCRMEKIIERTPEFIESIDHQNIATMEKQKIKILEINNISNYLPLKANYI